MNLEGKKILIAGLGVSGMALAKLCTKLGGFVTIFDEQNEEDLRSNIDSLIGLGAAFILGKSKPQYDDYTVEETILTFDMILLSPGVNEELPFLRKAIEYGIPIYGEVEFAYHFCTAPIIAITGTNGKSTTTTITNRILTKDSYRSYALGNIGHPLSDKVNELLESDYVVLEISERQLKTIRRFSPIVSAILNVTPEHLNEYINFQKYCSIKERIYMNQQEQHFCVINYDDPVCYAMSKKVKAKVVYFSKKHVLTEGVFLKDGKIVIRNNQYSDVEVFDTANFKVKGFVENALAATAISLCLGVSIDSIRAVQKEFEGLEHALEYVTSIKNVKYYNDSKATNPGSTIHALKSLTGSTVLIMGGKDDKNSNFSELIQLIISHVKVLILIGETANRIKMAVEQAGYLSIEMAPTLEQAVAVAVNISEPGDNVLFSPAANSKDMFLNHKQRGNVFKELIKQRSISHELEHDL